MYGYIYLTTNLINNKKYIGQHKSNVFDNNYIGSGILLAKAIKKYGKEYFTCKILECCDTKKELNEKEKYWISYYDATNSNDFYNIAFGGEGGEMPRECIEKAKTKISKANKGRIHTEETKRKMSESHKHKRGTYKRRYDCICKECGNKFQGLAWNSGICNKCKDK